MSREFDLILYGASGFTGQQAVAYLKRNAPRSLRWAIAGRNRQKLSSLNADVPLLVAAADKPDELEMLTARAQVILMMAGPFTQFGDPLVAACLRTGTDYCDISGETARIRRLIDRHHNQAEIKRIRIVNFCGASSTPADIAVQLLDATLGGKLVEAKAAVKINGGSFNGGTIASIADAIESGDALVEGDPFLLGPAPRIPAPVERDPRWLRYDRDLRAWTIPSPMGISDTRAVRRSAQLLGRDFTFQEYFDFSGKFAVAAASGTYIMLALMGAAFHWRPTRRLLKNWIKPGHGPSKQQMDKASYAFRVWGRGIDGVTAEVCLSGAGDPGNRITVLCVCQCALALTVDRTKLPDRFGVLTPAVAIGDILLRRLSAAGLNIEVTQSP